MTTENWDKVPYCCECSGHNHFDHNGKATKYPYHAYCDLHMHQVWEDAEISRLRAEVEEAKKTISGLADFKAGSDRAWAEKYEEIERLKVENERLKLGKSNLCEHGKHIPTKEWCHFCVGGIARNDKYDCARCESITSEIQSLKLQLAEKKVENERLKGGDKKATERLGMRPIPADGELNDSWYDWLINEYLPQRGSEDMVVFIRLGFDPIAYICWRLVKEDHIKDKEFAEAVKDVLEKREKCGLYSKARVEELEKEAEQLKAQIKIKDEALRNILPIDDSDWGNKELKQIINAHHEIAKEALATGNKDGEK